MLRPRSAARPSPRSHGHSRGPQVRGAHNADAVIDALHPATLDLGSKVRPQPDQPGAVRTFHVDLREALWSAVAAATAFHPPPPVGAAADVGAPVVGARTPALPAWRAGTRPAPTKNVATPPRCTTVVQIARPQPRTPSAGGSQRRCGYKRATPCNLGFRLQSQAAAWRTWGGAYVS